MVNNSIHLNEQKVFALQFNWVYISLVSTISVIPLMFITFLAFKQSSLAVFCIFLTITVSTFFFFLQRFYKDYNTVFLSDEAIQYNIFGRKKNLKWRFIDQIRIVSGASIHLISGDKKIVLSIYAFTNRGQLLDFLNSKVTEGNSLNSHG